MKKVAFIFVLAVLLPSLVLAWLAVRSLRDQQFLLERQQSLLCQQVTDALAQTIAEHLAQQQQVFGAQVENIVGDREPLIVGADFDTLIRQRWPLANVGFCVTLAGKILAPAANDRSEAQQFYLDNRAFLGNREMAEVYRSANANLAYNDSASRNAPSAFGSAYEAVTGPLTGGRGQRQSPNDSASPGATQARSASASAPTAANAMQEKDSAGQAADVPAAQNVFNYKAAQARKVSPQNQVLQSPVAEKGKLEDALDQVQLNLSKVVPAEAEFSQLVGSENNGMLARFLRNKLELLVWHRLDRAPDLVFGAQLNLNDVVAGLRDFIQTEPSLRDEICLALLDDNARPVIVSRPDFQANWKRPFVATEIGDALPHWEIAAYLVNPAQLTQAARTANLTLGLLIAVLLLAIGVGSWLIVRSLGAELKLARQKTDFVSNVSHELKTPLTSIRMFSELLAEGRVTDEAKQRSYLTIITAEAARLTRLINNVLDFSRLERGEKKYNFQSCNLAEVVRSTAETFRPHLEASGFQFDCELPSTAVSVHGDADALAQVIVNLLSNAEKYTADGRQITLQLAQKVAPLPHAELRVLDRGGGVPRGSGEKIFEQFYRAHDSLGSGIQGSGLGLTIARQIARAHGGDLVYEPRPGGGSCFILRLPIISSSRREEALIK